MTLEQSLEELGRDEEGSKHSFLVHLSSLNDEEMDQFRTWWPSLPRDRRRMLIGRLVTVAEDNVEMDYIGVFRYCLKDDDPKVRELAVSGLWECDDHNLVGPLMTIAKYDPSDDVRMSAVLALGKFGALAESGKLLQRDGERIKDALLSLLEDSRGSIEVRRRALEAVACFATPQVQELIQWAYNSPDIKLKVSALYAMGRTSDPAWMSTLIKEMSSVEASMRYEAASACGEMGEEDAVPYMIPLIEDEDSQVQVAAIKGLGVIGGSLAERALKLYVKAGDEVIQEAAQEALQQLDMEEDTPGFTP